MRKAPLCGELILYCIKFPMIFFCFFVHFIKFF